VLRGQGRKRKAAKAAATNATSPAASSPAKPKPKQSALDQLEKQIDACLTFARALDREGLESVISHLRRTRNEVVWKMGQ
jgi:hypothetical protein